VSGLNASRTLGDQRLNAQDLQARGRGEMGSEAVSPPGLETLLFGSPLSTRDERGDLGIHWLNPALRGVATVIRRELGTGEPVNQALLEWNRVVDLPLDFPGVQAKRAALLYALWREKDVQQHYSIESPQLVGDLISRVLPLTMPNFVANQGQASDALVVMVAVMCRMWDPRDVGAAEPEEESVPETDLREGTRPTR